MYSFRLNILRDTNVVWDNLSFNFCGEQNDLMTKICVRLVGCVDYLENINGLVVSKLLCLAA